MLGSIEFENYRGFKRFRLAGLSRVNLLVGKNACGKSSVLEAVQLFVSGGDPGVLARTASRRGETVVTGEGRESYRRSALPVISHFFHGHELGRDSYFSIRADDKSPPMTVRIVNLADIEKPGRIFEEQRRLFEDEAEVRVSLAIRFEGATHPSVGEAMAFPVTEEGAFSLDALHRYANVQRWHSDEVVPAQFISPDSREPHLMSEMWNKVITDGRETEVIAAMRILAPGLNNLFFLSGENAYPYGGRGGILVGFEGTRRRDPLGSHGDGMYRLLALSLSLIRSENGVLLVDEIDTGLHYSILGDMWRLVVEAARRANVQVFATTHSSDCVRGLAWLCENHPELRSEVSLQKVDSTLKEAVALDAERIVLAVNQGMEVR